MKPLAPKTILQNRYQIKKLIGKGGMGEVYLAIDQRLGHKVALKRTTVSHDLVLTEAFEREAKTLAQLRNSVLPKVSDHFREEDEQYLIMEYISGEDLSQKLKATNKPFPLNWVMFWADQLLESLTYLHTYSPPIIHRDIKPQNLKLTNENQIVLLDFGLSKNTVNKNEITTSGSVVGYTPHYAPMEQIRGTGTNASSDVFSLSATLYHLLSNTIPPDALTRADAMLSGLPDPLKPLTEVNPEITQAISDAILKGMSINQSNRFKTARDMQKVLRRAFNDMQSSMSAQTVAFNVSEEDIMGSDAKTEVISNLPLQTEEIPASAVSIDSDNQTVTHQPNLDVVVPVANLGDTDLSAEKTEVINVSDFSGDVNIDDSQFDENTSNTQNGEPTGIVTEVIHNESLPNETASDNFKTQEEIPAAIPSENDFKTNEDFSPDEFKTSDDDVVNEDFAPEATVPLIKMEDGIVENEVYEESLETTDETSWTEEFDSVGNDTTNKVSENESVEPVPVSVGFTEQFTNDELEDESIEELNSEPKYQTESNTADVSAATGQDSVPKTVPPKAKSSTGKYLAILGGFGAILFLLIGSVVAVGLYYNGTFGGGSGTDPVTETTPNAQVTPEQAPSVEPEPEPEVADTENTTDEGNSESETTDGETETTDGGETDSEDEVAETKTENPTGTKTTKNSRTSSSRKQETRSTKTTKNTSRPTRTNKKTTKKTTKKSTKKNTTVKKKTAKPKKKVKNAGVL